MWQESKSISATLVKPVAEVLLHAGATVGAGTAAGAAGTAAGGTAGVAVGSAGGAVAGAAAPVAAGAVAFAAGAAVGQAVHWLIHWGWDPVNPLSPLSSEIKFTSVHDLEIDSLLLQPPFGLPHASETTQLDDVWPGLGTLLLNFARTGVRAFVDGAQGVAAATAKEKAQLESAAAAFGRDLRDYGQAIDELADAVDHYQEVQPVLPKRFLSLTEFQQFIALSRMSRLPSLVDYEGAMIQRLFNLAQVRSETDIRPAIYEWLALGINKLEMETFQEARFQTLAFSEVLRVHARCLGLVDLSESPLLKSP